MKKLVANVQNQTNLQWQYNHKVIHVILSLSNAAAPAAPGYITQQVMPVKTRAIKNGRKQPQNFYTFSSPPRARPVRKRSSGSDLKKNGRKPRSLELATSFISRARSGPGRELSTGYPQRQYVAGVSEFVSSFGLY